MLMMQMMMVMIMMMLVNYDNHRNKNVNEDCVASFASVIGGDNEFCSRAMLK